MSDIKCRIYPLWHTLAECRPGHAGHGMQTGAFFSRSVRLIRIPDQRGLVGSTVTLDYLAFRLPQHFDLMSITAAVWVALNLVLQAAVYWWLRRTGRPESRMTGVLLLISLMLAILAAAHLIDYHWLKNTTFLQFQFLRLSPFITVFGVLSLLVARQVWAESEAGRESPISVALSIPALFVIAALWSPTRLVQIARQERVRLIQVNIFEDEPSPWVKICRWIGAHAPPTPCTSRHPATRASPIFRIAPTSSTLKRIPTERNIWRNGLTGCGTLPAEHCPTGAASKTSNCSTTLSPRLHPSASSPLEKSTTPAMLLCQPHRQMASRFCTGTRSTNWSACPPTGRMHCRCPECHHLLAC